MAISKAERKVMFEFFESILLSEKKPVYYEHLRGHISKACPVVQKFVHKECKGEKLLEYFQKRKNYFTVDGYEVSLKEKRLKKCHSGASSKSKEVSDFDHDYVDIYNSDEYSASSSYTCSESFASSRKSTLDFTDENESPIYYYEEMVEYEKVTFKYFSDYLARNNKLNLDKVEFNLLPKKVKRYLSKFMNKNILLFLQNYPDVFYIEDSCVSVMSATEKFFVGKESSSHEETSNISMKSCPVVENVEQLTSPVSAEEKAVENFLQCMEFFIDILKKNSSPVHVDKISGHLSRMPKKVYNYLNRNYKPYKLFFLDAPKVFLFNQQGEILLSSDHTKLLKRGKKVLRFIKDKSLSVSVQKVISLFDLPPSCAEKSNAVETDKTNIISDASSQSYDHFKLESCEEPCVESVSDVPVIESDDCSIVDNSSDNRIHAKAERAVEFFKECLLTVKLLCLEVVEKENILSLKYEYKAVKFFTKVLESCENAGCELSDLQGYQGQASNDVKMFLKQLYKGIKIIEFFQKNKEFELEYDKTRPNFLWVALSVNHQSLLEDRVKRKQQLTTRTKVYFQKLCNSHWREICGDFIKGLFFIFYFLQNKQKTKLSRLNGNISKLPTSLQSFINSFSGKEQLEKIKKFLEYFRFFVFPSEDCVAISSEVDISVIINIETDIDDSLKQNKCFLIENLSLNVDTFKTNVIQCVKHFLSYTSFVYYSDLPKILGYEIVSSLYDLKLQTLDLILILFESKLFEIDNGQICLKIDVNECEFLDENSVVNNFVVDVNTEVELEKSVSNSNSCNVQEESCIIREKNCKKKAYQGTKLNTENMDEKITIPENFYRQNECKHSVSCDCQVILDSQKSKSTNVANDQSNFSKMKPEEIIDENESERGNSEDRFSVVNDIERTKSQYMFMQANGVVVNNCDDIKEKFVQNERHPKDFLCESASCVHENNSDEEYKGDEYVTKSFSHFPHQSESELENKEMLSEKSKIYGSHPSLQSKDKSFELDAISSVSDKETNITHTVNELFVQTPTVYETKTVNFEVDQPNTHETKSIKLSSVNGTWSSNKFDACKLNCDLENEEKQFFIGMEIQHVDNFVPKSSKVHHDYSVENVEIGASEETSTSGELGENKCSKNGIDHETLMGKSQALHSESQNSLHNCQVITITGTQPSLLTKGDIEIEKSKEMAENITDNFLQESVNSVSSFENLLTVREKNIAVSKLAQEIKDDNLLVVSNKSKMQINPSVLKLPISDHCNSKHYTDNLHVISAEENTASEKDNDIKSISKIAQLADYESTNYTMGNHVRSSLLVGSKEVSSKENLLHVTERAAWGSMSDNRSVASSFSPVSDSVNQEDRGIDSNGVPEALHSSFEYKHAKFSEQKQNGTYFPFMQPLSGKVIVLSVDFCIVEIALNELSKFAYCLKSVFHCDQHMNCVKCFDSLNVGDTVSCYIRPNEDDYKFGNMCFSFMLCKDSTSDAEEGSNSQNSENKRLRKRYQSRFQDFKNIGDHSTDSCESNSVKKIPSYYTNYSNCSQFKESQSNPQNEVSFLSSTNDKVCEVSFSEIPGNIPAVNERECQTDLSGNVKLCFTGVGKEHQVNHPILPQSAQAVCKSSEKVCKTDFSEVNAYPTMVERACQSEFPTFSQGTKILSKTSAIECQTELSGKVKICTSVVEKEAQVMYSTSSIKTQTLNKVNERECQTDIGGKIKRCFDNSSAECQTVLSGHVKKCAHLANKSCQSLSISSLHKTSQTSPSKTCSTLESFTNSASNVQTIECSVLETNARRGREIGTSVPERAVEYCDTSCQTISTGAIMIKQYYM